MKLGSLISEVNILCLPQANFLNNDTFLFHEYAFSLLEHYPPLQNFEVRTLVSPLIPKIVLPTHLNPESPKKTTPPLLQGGEGMKEEVRGASIEDGRVVAYERA